MYDLYSQRPSRSYPLGAHPGRALAHGGAGTGLGLVYPDSEQRPKRAYPLGAHPLYHLARLTTGGGLGLEYPDFCQIPKRGYPLGAHPIYGLVCANGSTPPTPSPGGGGGVGFTERRFHPKYDRTEQEEADFQEFLTIITTVWL